MSEKCQVCGRCESKKCQTAEGWIDEGVEAVLKTRPNISQAELIEAVAWYLVDRVKRNAQGGA